MEMKPDVHRFSFLSSSAMPVVEKCVATPPIQDIAHSVLMDRAIETAAPKQSFLVTAMLKHVEFKAQEREYVADISRAIGVVSREMLTDEKTIDTLCTILLNEFIDKGTKSSEYELTEYGE
jgi:hypothetical protein